MRLDTHRLLELAGSLNEPRPAHSPGEARAAEVVGREFVEAGWGVERVPVRVGWRTRQELFPVVLCLIFFGWLAFGLGRLSPTAPPVLRLGIAGLATMSVGLASWARRRRERAEALRFPSVHLLATLPDGNRRQARLVVVTRLQTRSVRRPMLLLAVVLLVGFVPLAAHLSGSVPTLIPEGPRVAVCGLAVQWLGLLWLSGRSKGRSADTVSGDNRSGLALLAELSRNWPRSARERLETWLVAAADPAQLGESLQGRLADGKPTIVVALESPGVGSEVRVAGTGDAAELTADAAKALWLPHRRTWFPPRELGRGLAGAGVPFVSLRGAGDGRPIDPAALAGLAQLILEVALRWAKHVGSVGREPR